MLASVQEKVSLLTEVPDAVSFYLNPEFPYDEKALEKASKAADLLEQLANDFSQLSDWSAAKDTIAATATNADVKPGQLMFPLRVALSGKAGGPDLGAILQILGKDECVRRIRRLTTLLQ